MAIPPGLEAPGSVTGSFLALASLSDLPAGAFLRVTHGDLDLLLAHTAAGICAIDDRCPHMSAPLSLGTLEGCLIACPLHSGSFDLSTGEVVQFPTTGGLDPEGRVHRPWSPPDSPPKPEPSDVKARARAATRVRRVRYYPVRIRQGMVEVRLPG